MVSRAGAQGLAFVLVANALGVRQFGRYSAFAATAALIIPAAGLGLELALVKEHQGQPAPRRQLFHSLVTNLIVTLSLSAAGAWWLGVTTGDRDWAIAYAYLISESIVAHFSQHAYRQAVCRDRVTLGATLLAFPSWMRVLWAVLCVYLAAVTHLRVDTALWIYVAFASIVSAMLAARALVDAPPSGNSQPMRKLIMSGAGFAGGLTLRSLSVEYPKYLLTWRGDLASLAVFSAASRLFQLGALPVQAYLGNRLTTLVEARPSPRRLSAMRRSILALSCLSTLFVTALSLVMPTVLGEGFGDISWIAPILAVALVPLGMATLWMDFIAFQRGTGIRVVVSAMMVCLTVALASLGQMWFGMLGLAVAILVSQMVLMMGVSMIARRVMCR